MSKKAEKPKVWNPKDVYQHFAAQLLEKNPEYWGKYSKPRRMKNFWVYTKLNGKVVEVTNFDRWRNVMVAYFQSARDSIIQGQYLNMGNFVGKICARRVERNHKNLKIDFAATRQRPKVLGTDGKMHPDMIIYHTGDDWCRIAWLKTGQLPNETAYKFNPTDGDSVKDGFRQQFSKANKENPNLKYCYDYFPYVRTYPIKTTV